MPETPPNSHAPRRTSRILVLTMLFIIVLAIAAFLILKPDPSGAGHSTTNTTSDH
jgi:hypothetical protein